MIDDDYLHREAGEIIGELSLVTFQQRVLLKKTTETFAQHAFALGKLEGAREELEQFEHDTQPSLNDPFLVKMAEDKVEICAAAEKLQRDHRDAVVKKSRETQTRLGLLTERALQYCQDADLFLGNKES